MAKVDKGDYAFNETLKATDVKQPFSAKVTEVKIVGTMYGDKRVLILDNEKQIFLNALSLQNLVGAFSDEDTLWIGKEITVTTESSERTQGKKSVVVVIEGGD